MSQDLDLSPSLSGYSREKALGFLQDLCKSRTTENDPCAKIFKDYIEIGRDLDKFRAYGPYKHRQGDMICFRDCKNSSMPVTDLYIAVGVVLDLHFYPTGKSREEYLMLLLVYAYFCCAVITPEGQRPPNRVEMFWTEDAPLHQPVRVMKQDLVREALASETNVPPWVYEPTLPYKFCPETLPSVIVCLKTAQNAKAPVFALALKVQEAMYIVQTLKESDFMQSTGSFIKGFDCRKAIVPMCKNCHAFIEFMLQDISCEFKELPTDENLSEDEH